MILKVKVTPNSSKNQILGWEGEVLRIKLRGVPEKGKVNIELVEFLAIFLNVAKSRIEILNGHTSRLKKLKIEGIDTFPKI
ncbi:MAG: hypothetical protein COT85_00405 [Chlamydiae bacterium CG10_big_fil_rev_8_21_14_0_10_42_34]|nr:MAG: hypothetical protein COT85_00405 [Chlamydiae bacterium CG10_big_fil_rev_8_21_14_0_10_42_34]